MSNERFSFALPDEEKPTSPKDPVPASGKGALPGPGPDPNEPIKLECVTLWTDKELLDDLKRAIDPAKTYRSRMPDTAVWFQTSGENWLILAQAVVNHSTEAAVRQIKAPDTAVMTHKAMTAVKQLFEWMRHHVSLAEPLKIHESFEHLEYPQPEGIETWWDGSETIIEFP